MTIKKYMYSMIKSPQKNVADPAGSNLQPFDHQSDTHPTEPRRPEMVNCKTYQFFIYGKLINLSWDVTLKVTGPWS